MVDSSVFTEDTLSNIHCITHKYNNRKVHEFAAGFYHDEHRTIFNMKHYKSPLSGRRSENHKRQKHVIVNTNILYVLYVYLWCVIYFVTQNAITRYRYATIFEKLSLWREKYFLILKTFSCYDGSKTAPQFLSRIHNYVCICGCVSLRVVFDVNVPR